MKRTRIPVMVVMVALALCSLAAYLAYRNGSGETVSPSPNNALSERRIPDVSSPSRIPDGMRAVAIRVDDLGDVVPDSYVDVTTTRTSHSTLLLANVKVLAVGQSRAFGDREGAIVTLAVTVEEARRLATVREGTRLAVTRAGKGV